MDRPTAKFVTRHQANLIMSRLSKLIDVNQYTDDNSAPVDTSFLQSILPLHFTPKKIDDVSAHLSKIGFDTSSDMAPNISTNTQHEYDNSLDTKSDTKSTQ